ncbi:MAG TPA: hypothetical protein VLJ37_08480 [bacterium]|nr:hypothetical protein [bacterium]
MLRKILLILAVLSVSGGASGCLTGTGRTGGAPGTGPMLAPVTDGVGRSEGGGLPSSGMGGGDVPSGVTDRGGGDGAGDPSDGSTTDATSDAPIVVSGLPLGISPAPHCIQPGTSLYFSPVQLAVTGAVDGLGRIEILVKTELLAQSGTAVPGHVIDRVIPFSAPEDPLKQYGRAATLDGCLFARLYAPPSAAGKFVRIATAEPICQSDWDLEPVVGSSYSFRIKDQGAGSDPQATGAVNTAGDAMAMTMTKEGSEGPRVNVKRFGGGSSAQASLEFAIPAMTPVSSLPDCGGLDTGIPPVTSPAVNKGTLMERAP